MDIEKILDDLSYSMSSPEVDALNVAIVQKNTQEAHKILIEHLTSEKAKVLIEYFYKKNDKKVDLIEINPLAIPLIEDEKRYLIKVGSQLYNGAVFYSKGEYVFITTKGLYEIKEIHQAWEIK